MRPRAIAGHRPAGGRFAQQTKRPPAGEAENRENIHASPHRCDLDGIVPKETATAIAGLVRQLQDVDDITSLTRLLATPVQA
jgi:hypothetical protein